MDIKRISKNIVLTLIMIGCSSSLNAAKTVSSEMYIKKLEKSIIPLGKNLDDLKNTLKASINQKSFVSTDFWGLKPALYVENEARDLTTVYPFTKMWLNGYKGWDKHSKNLVRNINDIIFVPTNNKVWKERVYLEFNFTPERNPSDYKRFITEQFISNGVSKDKLDDALEHFSLKLKPIEKLFENTILKKIDTLYSGFTKFGDYEYLKMLADHLDKNQKLNLNNYLNPSMHNKVFTDNLLKEHLDVNSRKKLATSLYYYHKKHAKSSLFDYYERFNGSLAISSSIQYFEIAKGMSKNEKYNQLKQLENMLNKKILQGKLVVTGENSFSIYEDKTSDKIHKGRIAINYNTGEGYWQLPFYSVRDEIKNLSSQIKTNIKFIDKSLKNYMEIVISETVIKYKTKSIKTDDF